jgi:phage terminase small subunit
MSLTEGGDTPKPLTAKQEAFALAYVECGNASEAYRRSYNCKPDAKPEGITVNASKLLADANVALRVQALQSRAAASVVLTRAWVLEQLMHNAQKARAPGVDDFAASNKALELLGKTDEVGGMFTDKSESKVTGSMAVTTVVDRPPSETREDWLARRRRELAGSSAAMGSTARPAN